MRGQALVVDLLPFPLCHLWMERDDAMCGGALQTAVSAILAADGALRLAFADVVFERAQRDQRVLLALALRLSGCAFGRGVTPLPTGGARRLMVFIPPVVHQLVRETPRTRKEITLAAFVEEVERVDRVAEDDREEIQVEAETEGGGFEAVLDVEDVLTVAIRSVDDGLRRRPVVEPLRDTAADAHTFVGVRVQVLHRLARHARAA